MWVSTTLLASELAGKGSVCLSVGHAAARALMSISW